MKKSLALLFALAAGVASAASYYLPTGPTTANLPAYNYSEYGAPRASASFSMEVGAAYVNTSIKDSGLQYKDYNYVGPELTGLIHVTDNWAVSISVSSAYANEAYVYEGRDRWTAKVERWSLMVGTRYTTSVSENANVFVGASIGLARESCEECWYDTFDGESEKWEGKGRGVDYAAEIGLNYYLTDSIYVYGAARFWGTTVAVGNASDCLGLGARAGIGVSF